MRCSSSRPGYKPDEKFFQWGRDAMGSDMGGWVDGSGLAIFDLCSIPYGGPWAISAAVAQQLYTLLVGGSNPSSPTNSS